MNLLTWLARIRKVTTQSQSQLTDNPTDHSNPYLSDIRATSITEENMDDIVEIEDKTYSTNIT